MKSKERAKEGEKKEMSLLVLYTFRRKGRILGHWVE
jgi:hypothetical protein